jgi:hypothetical protein
MTRRKRQSMEDGDGQRGSSGTAGGLSTYQILSDYEGQVLHLYQVYQTTLSSPGRGGDRQYHKPRGSSCRFKTAVTAVQWNPGFGEGGGPKEYA